MADDAKQLAVQDLLTPAEVAKYCAEHGIAEQDWSGLPVPVIGLNLVLEPRYKHKGIADFRWESAYDENGNPIEIESDTDFGPSGYQQVNAWWNAKLQATVLVFKDWNGRSRKGLKMEHRLSLTLQTLLAAPVWPLEAEEKAQRKLATMIDPHDFHLYMVSGHFSEVSKRSRVTYLFRKGRPTIALREEEDSLQMLCALCLHPIGYYAGTWAGVMCPTDEVIAHLLMMRGSEEKFWANANQHSLDHPAAGV
jgi:hypothetical protein